MRGNSGCRQKKKAIVEGKVERGAKRDKLVEWRSKTGKEEEGREIKRVRSKEAKGEDDRQTDRQTDRF